MSYASIRSVRSYHWRAVFQMRAIQDPKLEGDGLCIVMNPDLVEAGLRAGLVPEGERPVDGDGTILGRGQHLPSIQRFHCYAMACQSNRILKSDIDRLLWLETDLFKNNLVPPCAYHLPQTKSDGGNLGLPW
jgi:hypothetical protein